MTKANQVAPLLATVRGLISDATEAIDEFAKLAKYVDEVEARAEQAEYSLAASERALAALRYQAQAGGCELSTVGENSYHCRADALCGLCRLRHRASQAERSLATLRELIHTASGLDDHRYSAEQMVKEMAERWQGASDDCEKAEQALATVTAERDEARAERDAAVDRLVGARVARESAIEDAEALRAQLSKTARERDDAMTLAEERRDYARAQNAKLSVECDDLRAQLTAVERERDEAKAELERRKEELRLAQCPNPRDPKNGGHCDTCSGLSVARTRQLHEQEQRIAELKALNRDNLAMWEVERDALKAKLAEAEWSFAGYNAKLHAEALRENDVLRSRLAKTEAVVEAARARLTDGLKSAAGLDHTGPGSASFSRIFPEDTYPTNEKEADAFVKARMRLWFTTWIVTPMKDALRVLDDSPVGGSSVDPRPLCIQCAKPWVPLEGCDATVELCPACWYRGERPGVAGTDSEGGAPCTGQVTPGTVSGGASGAATPEGGHAAPTGGPMPPPEPAGSSCCPGCACGVCISRFLEPVPPEVHERGWQWRPVGDGAFAPPFGTVRACVGCGCLVAGGPTACARCAQDSPVGVAATACDHKQNMPTPESNEGLITSGACRPDPPPDYLTRAELVAAVRSAAAHVGGPPGRALDALADALAIPPT